MPKDAASNQRNGRARQRYLARRLEILRAAGKEFQTRGFAETGMREIGAAAGLSPANLYNYFRGKDEILFFCQDNSLDRMMAALEKARRSRSSAAGRLRIVIVAHMRCVLDEVEGSAAHLLTSALPALMQRPLVAKRDRYEEGVRQLISSGARSGEFVRCDPALAARAILGALNWSARWFRPEGALTAGEIADRFADYLIRGLLARPNGLGLARTKGGSTLICRATPPGALLRIESRRKVNDRGNAAHRIAKDFANPDHAERRRDRRVFRAV